MEKKNWAAAASVLACSIGWACTQTQTDDPEGTPDGSGDTSSAGSTGGSGTLSTGASGSGGSTARGGSGGSGSIAAVTDPAPAATSPGETKTCSTGGPDSDLSVFVYADVTDTAIRLNGTVTGAVGNGSYYVAGGASAIDGPVETSSGGGFDLTLPLFCGEQLVKLVWSDATCQLAAVTQVTRVNCAGDDIRLTLSWDDLGADFELHLVKPGGRINDNATDCTWTSCLSRTLDWGVSGDLTDNPVKDVDDTNAFGPENIYYSVPEPGRYTVLVEHWGAGSPDADGQVVFNVNDRTSTAKIQNLPSHSVWTAGTIEWPSGQVTLSQDVYDCSGNWSGGCRDQLPPP